MACLRCFSCKRSDFYSQRGLSVHRAKNARRDPVILPRNPSKSLWRLLHSGRKRRNDCWGTGTFRRVASASFSDRRARALGIDSGADPSPSTIVEPPLGPDPRPERVLGAVLYVLFALFHPDTRTRPRGDLNNLPMTLHLPALRKQVRRYSRQI